MDTTYLLSLLLVGLICFIAGAMWGRRRAQRAGPMIMQSSPLTMSRPASAPPNAAIAGEMEDVRAYIRAGQMIRAIKAYRDRTGRGLKESKDAVEALAREMRIR